MPLLDAHSTNGSATFICAACGHERTIPKGRWVLSDEDPAVFTSPPCPQPCGAQETLFWHDWVFESSRTKPVPVKDNGKPRKVFDHTQGKEVEVTQTETETYMDDEHFGAQQMVLIGRVGKALQRKQAKRSNGKVRYDREPKAPDPDEVGEHVPRAAR